MRREDLQELEKQLMEQVVTRRKLGGYSPDAPGLLLLCESVMRLVQHELDKMPNRKKPVEPK